MINHFPHLFEAPLEGLTKGLPMILFVCSADLANMVIRYFPSANPRKKLLAIYLSWRCRNDEGTGITLYVQEMASPIGASERQTQRLLRQLTEDGFVELARPGRGRSAASYNIAQAWIRRHAKQR